MSVQAPALDGPAPQLIFRRKLRPWAMARELWGAREMVRALAERELLARYKQTKMGAAWALLVPLMMMAVFSAFLAPAANIDTGGLPGPLFFYVAMLPWTFFANSVAKGSVSITQNLALVNKVYCPREVFPLSYIATAAVDTLLASTILVGLFAIYGRMPEAQSVWVPLLLLIMLVFTVGVTLLLSALVVYLRDLRQVLPMVIQYAMFATPVVYTLGDMIPSEGWQKVTAAVNPLAPVIDDFRRTVLLGQEPRFVLLAIAGASSLVWLVGGYAAFKKMETGFADIA